MREWERERARPSGSNGSDGTADAELDWERTVGLKRTRTEVGGRLRSGVGSLDRAVMDARYAACARPALADRTADKSLRAARAISQEVQ